MANGESPSGGHTVNAGVLLTGETSGRVAVICLIAAFALQVTSALIYAAAGVSTDLRFDAATLLATSAGRAGLFHWASVADLFGYLLVAPMVAYLYHRFRDDPHMALYTAAGFAFILIGALASATMLAAGPTLLRAYASAAGPERAAVATAFKTVFQVVAAGLWQTLEGLPGGVWLFGVGLNLYRDGSRALSALPFAFATLFFALAVARLVTF